MRRRDIFLARLILLLCPLTALAAAPVAIVEQISDGTAGVERLEAFDFVAEGDDIELGSSGKIALGYLESCVREEISGGKVTIGTLQSNVVGGQVSRTRLNCDGQHLSLAANESMQSGVIAFRDIGKPAQPPLTVYSPSPLFKLSGAGKLVVKRIDLVGERHTLRLQEKAGGTQVVDFASEGIALAPGATYMASFSGRTITFRVDGSADIGNRAPLQRMVPL